MSHTFQSDIPYFKTGVLLSPGAILNLQDFGAAFKPSTILAGDTRD
jgi:hypothetical protein